MCSSVALATPAVLCGHCHHPVPELSIFTTWSSAHPFPPRLPPPPPSHLHQMARARARGGGAVQHLSLRDWALHAPRRPQGPRGLPLSASLFCGRCSTMRTCHASVRVTRSVCASIRGRGGRPCLSAIQSSRTDLTVITRPRGSSLRPRPR